ncbi:NADH-quinone oxidoreductase subunit A [Candidatus Bathyarchaeota archaeon]|nr:NADH-quinone oxidoreductase subunit A [Candidatus Bathyarchaeota archaeon]MBS7630015.1 NADH-quinone oxidoreductase subunit A [Candidatus Bathyarchaeota archaeon]
MDIKMIYFDEHMAFWVFSGVFIGFLGVAILIARLIGPIKPNKIKETTYECGQKPFGSARNFRITGITKYFGYAVIFFALDAFTWIILTAAISLSFNPSMVMAVTIYTIIVLVSVCYFLMEVKRLVE